METNHRKLSVGFHITAITLFSNVELQYLLPGHPRLRWP